MSSAGALRRPRRAPRRPLVIAGGLLGVLVALLLAAPLAVVVASAFAPSEALGVTSEQWIAGAGAGRAFRLVLATYGDHLGHSALLALAAGAVALVVGGHAGLALGLAPARLRAARWIETAIALPLGMPGLIVAFALIVTYPSRHAVTPLLLVGHVLYTLPYAVATVATSSRAARLGALLDAARTLGAGRAERARRVAWPALRRSLAVGLAMALSISWGEFNVTFLLATPSEGTFPTALFLTYSTNSFPVAAAATTIFLVGLVPLVLVALLLEGRAPVQGA